MITLVLVRHAKSSWKYDVSDKERPLKSRGFTDAKLVSEKFLESNFFPDLVFSSPANRALSTCRIFLQNMNISSKKMQIIDQLYDFGGHNVVEFLKSIDENVKKVMIFGHNHAFTSIVNSFGSEYIDNLPTAGLAMIDFDVDSWQELNQGETKLMILPRDLK